MPKKKPALKVRLRPSAPFARVAQSFGMLLPKTSTALTDGSRDTSNGPNAHAAAREPALKRRYHPSVSETVSFTQFPNQWTMGSTGLSVFHVPVQSVQNRPGWQRVHKFRFAKLTFSF